MVTLASISYIFKAFIEGAVIFIGRGSLAIKRRLFKIAKAKVNRYGLRQWLIIYKLKSLLLLINSLISVLDYFIKLSL